jgi:hypothetical protein
METGTIIKSTNFHAQEYWVVKCDNPNLKGNRNGELPINPLTMPSEWNDFMGRWYNSPLLNKRVKFELEEIGDVENYKWYAHILVGGKILKT